MSKLQTTIILLAVMTGIVTFGGYLISGKMAAGVMLILVTLMISLPILASEL